MGKNCFKTVNIKNERQLSLKDKKKSGDTNYCPSSLPRETAGPRAAGVT